MGVLHGNALERESRRRRPGPVREVWSRAADVRRPFSAGGAGDDLPSSLRRRGGRVCCGDGGGESSGSEATQGGSARHVHLFRRIGDSLCGGCCPCGGGGGSCGCGGGSCGGGGSPCGGSESKEACGRSASGNRHDRRSGAGGGRPDSRGQGVHCGAGEGEEP